MAALAPLALEGAEVLGSSLLGKEGIKGLSKLANTAIAMYSKEGKSPSRLLAKILNRGKAVISNPENVKHALEEVSKAGQIAQGSGKHLVGALHQAGVLSSSRSDKLHQGLSRINHNFHNALGKLGKLHHHLAPFLSQ